MRAIHNLYEGMAMTTMTHQTRRVIGGVDTHKDAHVAALVDEAYGAKVERGFVIDVEAYDWNCPQHITPRYTQSDVAKIIAPLQRRIAELEAASDAKGHPQ